jgi:hypothetical protein
MTEPLPDQYAQKQSIIRAFFIDTADDNYVLARFCFHANLDVDFFWLAVHCLEKYLKAALLCNDRSSKGYSHRIVDLYKDVEPLAPELLPETLPRPHEMQLDLWHLERTKDFIARLYSNGQAANRYQLFGYALRAEDLLKLDQIVFNVRRLCQPLEAHFLFRPRAGLPDESKRQRMNRDEGSWKLHGKLEEIMAGKQGETLQNALLDWNYPFAPDGRVSPSMPYRYSSRDSVLIRRLLDPLRLGGPRNFAEVDKLWRWIKANIEIPRDLHKAIQDEMDSKTP